MNGRRLILLMSVSMGDSARRPDGTIDWLTPAPAVTTATQRHRLTLKGAPGTEGESRWES